MNVIEFCDRHDACEEGREWALANCRDMDHAWEVLKPEWLIWVATREGVLDDRTLRLFAVWCARRVQHLMTDPRSVAALDVAERFANGAATADELRVAWDAAKAAGTAARAAWDAGSARTAARDAAVAAWDAARAAAGVAAGAAAGAAGVAARVAAEAAAGAAGVAARVALAAALAAEDADWDAGSARTAALNAASAGAAGAVGAESIKLQADWLRANAKPSWEAKR